MGAFSPAAHHEQQCWLMDWQTAMQEMHYLDVKQLGISDSLKTLIRIRGQLRKPNLNLELVQPDVEMLWRETCARAQEAAHVIRPNETGFECEFFAIRGHTYITGSVAILRCAYTS
jgi:hypothetical protein